MLSESLGPELLSEHFTTTVSLFQTASVDLAQNDSAGLDTQEDSLPDETGAQRVVTDVVLRMSQTNASNSIARSIMPLPSDITGSPLNKFLWSYFVDRGTEMFQCWDPDTTGFLECPPNPYRTVLASMAIRSLPVRLAALALSAFLYGMNSGKPLFIQRASRLWHQSSLALSDAQSVHSGKTQSLVETAATALLLLLVDSHAESNLLALARSAVTYMIKLQGHGQFDETSEVVFHILRWAEISWGCSLRTIQLPGRHENRAIEFHGTELQTNLTSQFSSWVIHPLYTFSHRWINPLLSLGRLLQDRKSGEATKSPEAMEAWDEEAAKLEEDLLTARDLDLAAWERGASENADLLNLNEAMHSAIVLLFYSRARDMAWTTPIIRRNVLNICQRLSDIDVNSRTLNNIVFPLYTAGCEAVDISAREQLESLTSRLHSTGYWFSQQSKLVMTLRQIWEIRDRDPGAPWLAWSQQVPHDVSDCIPLTISFLLGYKVNVNVTTWVKPKAVVFYHKDHIGLLDQTT
ncbi:hypothetical protein IFR05_011508 [Cadophora sp. M221]|nr:hypothetical protein IFR05_011508 [Cadophora sp. M221]